MNEDMEEGIIVLVDENGDEVEFEHLDTIEMNGKEYVILLPMDQDETEEAEDNDAGDVIILRIDHGDEEDSFATIDDEKELEGVFTEFKRRVDEEYEFEDEQ